MEPKFSLTWETAGGRKEEQKRGRARQVKVEKLDWRMEKAGGPGRREGARAELKFIRPPKRPQQPYTKWPHSNLDFRQDFPAHAIEGSRLVQS